MRKFPRLVNGQVTRIIAVLPMHSFVVLVVLKYIFGNDVLSVHFFDFRRA